MTGVTKSAIACWQTADFDKAVQTSLSVILSTKTGTIELSNMPSPRISPHRKIHFCRAYSMFYGNSPNHTAQVIYIMW